MIDTPRIPPATASLLNGDIPKGERHLAKLKIAMSLIGNGFSPAATFQTLRDKFPAASDKEIEDAVTSAENKHPTPSGFGTRSFAPMPQFRAQKPIAAISRTPEQQCRWWMGETALEGSQMASLSPIPFQGTLAEELITFLESLYKPEEEVNIVCDYTEREGKANPQGAGEMFTQREWCDYIRRKGIPESKAGAWVRPNPCKEGSGSGGAVTDADVTSHRFLLIESDCLPVPTQLALYTKLKLPIAAMMMSGGKSAHAWLAVNCPDDESYREVAKRVFAALAPFGVDKANKNPSRLSRLPSAKRVIGADGDGVQKLLYLAHHEEVFDPSKLEKMVTIPLVNDQPMHAVAHESVNRFEELYNNRGKLGVQVGLGEFDKDTGGLKPGQVTVLAAGTNQGKSTVALNFIIGALENGHGTALFTLEMDRDEIADLIFSNICRVNRNAFNTGYFADDDFSKITNNSSKIAKLPLWIFDEAAMTTEAIRDRVDALNAEKKITLVVIDYVQIVTHPDARLPREQQVAEVARAIRIMAKETKLPFVILSQLNDDGKLRESRVVAHEAHNVILIEPNDQQTEMVLKVIKGRRIMKKDYQVHYQPQYARIHSSPVDPSDLPVNGRDYHDR